MMGACITGGSPLQGVCVAGGMHGRVVCMVGACITGGSPLQGVCVAGGHAWQRPCMAGEMATAAGVTHPTGMHSCSMNKLTLNKSAKMTLTFPKNDVTECTGHKTTDDSLIHGGLNF